MKTVRLSLLLTAVGVALVSFATVTKATIVIWSEDFSNVSDWQVVFDPGSGSTITSDGNLGLFHVPNANNLAAFGPIPSGPFAAPLVAFDITRASDYAMDFTVPSLTDSTSYDIRLDQFDANTNYLSTILGVFSQQAFTGSTNISLGGFTYSNGTVFLLPKITVFTGNGDQTVRFDSMDFTESVPEPSIVVLLAVGLGVMWRRHKKWKSVG